MFTGQGWKDRRASEQQNFFRPPKKNCIANILHIFSLALGTCKNCLLSLNTFSLYGLLHIPFLPFLSEGAFPLFFIATLLRKPARKQKPVRGDRTGVRLSESDGQVKSQPSHLILTRFLFRVFNPFFDFSSVAPNERKRTSCWRVVTVGTNFVTSCFFFFEVVCLWCQLQFFFLFVQAKRVASCNSFSERA